MQGYILNVKKAKNEDTIVSILTKERLEVLYRFYGARHPVVTTGFKVDFEIEKDSIQFLPKLRNVIHLGFPWLKEINRLTIWQNFITLLYDHLKDVEIPGSFYFDILEHSANIWQYQNPMRTAIESYLSILEHEGRLHEPDNCFICSKPLEDSVSLIRAYLPAHPKCVIAREYRLELIKQLMETKKSILLDDNDVEGLWLTLLEGM
jgi:recombinational DNA repair protein (RecF pathway)